MIASRTLSTLLIIGIFAGTFLLISSAHGRYPVEARYLFEPLEVVTLNYTYPYPLHGDEWTHLAKAKYTQQTGRLAMLNPYHPAQAKLVNLEGGFSSYLSSLISFLGNDYLEYFYILPAFFGALIAVLIYLLAFRITQSWPASLISSLLFASIGSNINILGFWFFLPVTLGIMLLLLYFMFDGTSLLLKAIVFLTLAVVYPLLCPVVLAYEAYNYRKNKLAICAVILLGLLGIGIAYLLVGWQSVSSYIISEKGWTQGFEVVYNPLIYFGIAGSLLAGLGLWFGLKERKSAPILIVFLFALANIILFKFYHFTIVLPYQRSFLLLMVSMALLGGFGTIMLNSVLASFMKNKPVRYAVIVMAVTIAVFFSFHNYFDIEKKQFIPILYLTNEQIRELSNLENDAFENAIFVTPPGVSFTVYPVLGGRITALAGSNLGFGDYKQLFRFEKSDCAAKLEYMQKNNASFIISHKKLSCPWLTQITAKSIYLYGVD